MYLDNPDKTLNSEGPMGHGAGSDVTYRFESFCLDAGGRILTKEGKKGRIHLRSKALDVLLALVESAGKLVTKEDLQNKVWPGITVEPNNIDQQISTLRQVLGKTPGKHNYIETVPRQGYRFVARVKTFRMKPPEPEWGFIDEESGELVEVVDGTLNDKETEVGVRPGYEFVGFVPPTQPGYDDLSTEEIMDPNNQDFEKQRTEIVDGRTPRKRRHSLSPRTESQLPPARPKKKRIHSLSTRTKSPLPPAHPTQRSRRRHR
jgi:DNA-binding winged helix-turn-helix (wHTH) protein